MRVKFTWATNEGSMTLDTPASEEDFIYIFDPSVEVVKISPDETFGETMVITVSGEIELLNISLLKTKFVRSVEL